MCKEKKKDLEVIISQINKVIKMKEKVIQMWKSCLKNRAKKNPDEMKMNIHSAKLEMRSLVTDIIEIEKTVKVEECEAW